MSRYFMINGYKLSYENASARGSKMKWLFSANVFTDRLSSEKIDFG